MKKIKSFIKITFRFALSIFLRLTQLYYKIFGHKVECNLCSYKANIFASDSWHKYIRCPYCSSSVRHRLLIAVLSNHDKSNFNTVISNKSVLRFAPEKYIKRIIQKKSKEYKTADFFTEGYHYDTIDYPIDMADMKVIKDESFDCVIACDVLEHIKDHNQGIREVHRILKKNGCCIFTVPQKDNLKRTIEDLTISDNNERERLFGQFDHWRVYGDDFVNLLEGHGFEVTAVDEKYFDKKMAEYHVLFPPILSTRPLATNYRKIFLGLKA